MTPTLLESYTIQKVRTLRNGLIAITMSRTWEVQATSVTVHRVDTVTAADLAVLEAWAVAQHTQYGQLEPDLWQYFIAANILRGKQAELLPERQRRRTDSAIKSAASPVGKLIYLFVKSQWKLTTDKQTPAFRQALHATRETLNGPQALAVTAWATEQYFGARTWDTLRLPRPTRNAKFKKTYLYTKPGLTELAKSSNALPTGSHFLDYAVSRSRSPDDSQHKK